jgi:hypothetical protein
VPYDLVAGKPIKDTKAATGYTLDLSMDRFGGSLVAFYPEAIERVTVKAPSVAKPLTEVVATIQVLGKRRPISGVVPVEVTLLDPSGKPSVLSGVLGAKSGSLTYKWTPAVNDPKGKWTLKVTELASGKSTSTSGQLKY